MFRIAYVLHLLYTPTIFAIWPCKKSEIVPVCLIAPDFHKKLLINFLIEDQFPLTRPEHCKIVSTITFHSEMILVILRNASSLSSDTKEHILNKNTSHYLQNFPRRLGCYSQQSLEFFMGLQKHKQQFKGVSKAHKSIC